MTQRATLNVLQILSLTFLALSTTRIAMAELIQTSLNIEATVNEQIQPLVDSNLSLNKRYIGIWVGIFSPEREFINGYGERELGKQNPPNETTFFEIGSISKTFTGISLAMSGLDLSQNVQDLLPKEVLLPTFDGSPIKLIHLVTHTSGLPSIGDNIKSLQDFLEYSPIDAFAFLKNYELKRYPGQQYEYSNLGFGLLAHVLNGSSPNNETRHFEKLASTISKPLGMDETVVFLNSDQKSRMTESYDHDGNSGAHWNWGPNSLNAGAGALKSTGRDMMKYLRANLGIGHSTIDTAIAASHMELFRVNETLSVGYGWHILKLGSDRIIWHNGGTGGFQTFLGFNKEKRTGVIILANTSHRTDNSPVDPRIDQAAISILRKLE